MKTINKTDIELAKLAIDSCNDLQTLKDICMSFYEGLESQDIYIKTLEERLLTSYDLTSTLQ